MEQNSQPPEYQKLMEQAPQISASGLEGDYRALVEFNDVVLAGHQTRFGMEFVTWEWVLEPLYRGGAFPPYLYDTYPLALEATPCSKPEDTENVTLLCLPMTEKQLEHALARGGIGSVEQMRFKVDAILVRELGCILDLEQESLTDLNEMCRVVMPLVHTDLLKLGAAITFAKPQSAMQVKHLAENLELFEFIPKVKTPEEYGRYMIQESGHFEYDENLESFYDFVGYARQRMSQEQGQFVENGYIS